MRYSKQAAEKLASQIHERFGERIAGATRGSVVPAEFLAGLISVEAGKDSKGQIKENATRFESHVFAKLKQVRDGKLLQYNKIRRAQIADASDAALKSLATSCGLTQIMQWWSIQLGISVAELRGPNHLKHAVKLLGITALDQLQDGNYEGALRIWNSGRPTGATHDPAYVDNALAVMEAYGELEPVEVVEPVIPPAPKPEPEKPSVETVGTRPPVIEVKSTGVSWTTKIASITGPIGAFFTTIGLKIGGVQFTQTTIIILAMAYMVTIIVGAWIYNEGQKRNQERLRLSMSNLADPERGNVVAGSGSES